ncbi:MAG: SMI1/KNR4 family protein [Clostridia bacterium]|nr:SMI1/KNR4 family protein [Clostridia bacterium]
MYKKLIENSRYYINNPGNVKFKAPCTYEAIDSMESEIGYELPESLKSFLCETNGDGCLMYSLEDIRTEIEYNRTLLVHLCKTFEDYLDKIERFIAFASNDVGDSFGFRVLPDATVDDSLVYMRSYDNLMDYVVVAKDIPDLISRYYNCYNYYNWGHGPIIKCSVGEVNGELWVEHNEIPDIYI